MFKSTAPNPNFITHIHYTDCFYYAETIPTFKNISKENLENCDKKINLNRREDHCTKGINVVKTIIGKA